MSPTVGPTRMRLRELWPVFVIAVAVTILGTLSGSLFDKIHKVDAEEISTTTVGAKDAGDGTQVIDISAWGVRMSAPIAAELPTLRYTTGSGDSVGLSSADLEKLSPACSAGRSGLGTLVRLSAGSFQKSAHGDPTLHFIGTINGHDYAYQSPINACADTPSASDIINRETSIIFSSLETLAQA
jgi:hypothetical protein